MIKFSKLALVLSLCALAVVAACTNKDDKKEDDHAGHGGAAPRQEIQARDLRSPGIYRDGSCTEEVENEYNEVFFHAQEARKEIERSNLSQSQRGSHYNDGRRYGQGQGYGQGSSQRGRNQINLQKLCKDIHESLDFAQSFLSKFGRDIQCRQNQQLRHTCTQGNLSGEEIFHVMNDQLLRQVDQDLCHKR